MKLSNELLNQLKLYFVSRKSSSTVGGNIVPDENDTYNLGDTARRFDTIYARQVVADSLTGEGSSDTVDGFHAYSTPQPNALLALDGSSTFPTSVYPSALLTNGTRQLTGNLAVSSGVTIDGVDISAHAVSTVHHLSGMTTDDHSQYVHTSLSRSITASHQFAPASPAAPFSLTANAQGQTVVGFRADQLNKSVTAGNGLTGGGTLTSNVTLAVGAGNGITVNTSDVAVRLKTTSGLEVDSNGLAVADTLAGNGLSMSSKVISVGAGTLISTSSTAVSLANGTAQYQVPATGATPFTPAWTNLSTFAGNGLVFSSGTFAVGAGNGIQVSSTETSVKLKTTSGLEVDGAGLAVADTLAGNGMTITGKVLNVGAGALINVSSTAVSVANGTAQYQVLVTGATPFTPVYTGLGTFAGDGLTFMTAHFQVALSSPSGLEFVGVTPNRTIQIADSIAGNGLSMTSKVLHVGAGPLITVAADTVGVANGTEQYQLPVTGVAPYAPAYVSMSTFAGAGLTASAGALHVGAGNGITVNADDVTIRLKTTSGLEVDSNGLAVADAIAGDGLTISGKILHVGAGALINVDANSVRVANGTAQWQIPVTGGSPFTPAYTGLSTLAGDGVTFSTTFSIALSTTSGLQLVGSTPNKTLEINDTLAGNGLSMNSKVLSVGAGTLISVGSTTVSVANGTAQYQIPVTGVSPFTPAYTALSTFAGNGLNFTGGQFVLGTPSTLSAGSTNQVTGSTHTHQIQASANPGASEFILKTTPAGGLTLASLAVTGAATVGQDLTVGANVLFVNQSLGLVGINCVADPQFQLDVNSNIRARGYIVGKHAIQLKDAKLIAHYDGPEPFETNYTGDGTGHMGQVATLTGGVIFRPGKFNKGIQVAEATTNLVVNPSFEDGSTGWSFYSVPSAFSVSGIRRLYGGNALRFSYTSSGSSTPAVRPTTNSAASEGQTYTLTAYVNVDITHTGAMPRYYIQYLDAGSNTLTSVYTTPADVRGVWQRVELTSTAPASTAFVRILVAYLPMTDGQVAHVYTDAVQLENKSYSTPYCDGSLGPGHTWSGTAHQSTSSRTVGRVSYAATGNIDLNQGSASFWFYNNGVVKNSIRRGVYFFIDTNNRIAVNVDTTGTLTPVAFSVSEGVIASTITGAAAPVVGWNHVVATWKVNGQLKFYLNGVQSGASPNYTPPVGGPGAIYVGSDNGSSATANDLIDDVVIVGREISADEIRAIYESDAPVFAESSTWAFKSTSQLVWADEEGLWVIDSAGTPSFGVSGVDNKSWGGSLLNKGDVLIGNASNYIKWTASSGLLQLYSPGSSLTTEEYFQGTLPDFNQRWTSVSGSGEMSIVSGGVAGGNVLRIGDNSGDDTRRLVSNQSVPFDPNKLYRIFLRVRQVARSGGATLYCGVAGRNAADNNWVTPTGANATTPQYYIAASNASLPVVGEGGAWSEYVGYFRGVNTTNNGGYRPLASNPATLHTDVKYFRLFLWVNFNTEPGIVEVDEFRVDILPNVSDSPWSHTTDTTTIDGGKIYTGSITADKITTATLSAITADMGTVTAGSIVIGTTNKIWLNDSNDGALAIGGTVKGAAPFRVTATGALTATDATINGNITATTGAIGGLTIASTKIYVGVGTFNNSNTAFYVDNTGQLSLGNKLSWNGTALVVDGQVTATSGAIGGWSIATNTLSATNVLLDSNSRYIRVGATPASMTFGSTAGVQIEYNGGSPRVYFGNGTNRFVNFDGTNLSFQAANTSLTTGGLFTASDANITGTIDANAGFIGTLTVDGTLTVGTGGIIRSGATAYNAGTGFWFDHNAGTPRLFVGNSAANKMTWDGSSLTITGAVNATTGSLGDLTVSGTLTMGTSGVIKSGTATYNGTTPSGAGYYLTYTGSTTNFMLGNATADYLTWSSSQGLVIVGDITADGGNIGGWAIQPSYLVRDTGVNATSAGLAPGDYPFYAGATYANRNTAPFRVTPAGALTATSGTIGGWTLSSTSLSSGGITLVSHATPASNKMYVGSGNYGNGDTAFYVDGSGRMSLKDKLLWNGTDLNISGSVVLGSGYAHNVPGARLYLSFDTPTTPVNDLQVKLEGHLGQSPTTVGTNIWGWFGKFGTGLFTGEATTNLCSNPSAETNTTGWGQGGSNPAIQRVQEVPARFGQWVFKGSRTDAGNNLVGFSSSQTLTAVAHTVSLWVYIPTAYASGTGVAVSAVNFTGATGTLSASADMNKKGQWQFLTYTFTPDAGDLVGNVVAVSAGNGESVYWDAVQIEAKAYPTSYCDTSRTANRVHYPTVTNSDNWSISVWFATPYSSYANGPTINKVVSWYIDNNNRIELRHISSSNRLENLWVHGGSSTTSVIASSGDTPPAWTWSHVVMTYDGTNLKTYYNGVLKTNVARSAHTTGAASFYIGTNPFSSTASFNGMVDDIAVLDYVMTDADVSSLYQTNQPIRVQTSPYEILLTDTGQGKVWGNARGLFGQDTAGTPSFALVNTNGVSWASTTLDAGDAMIGNSTAYLKWDTSLSELEVKGKVTALSGLIGNWTINSTYLARDTGTASTSSGMSPTDYPFYAGATYANRATAPFRITPAGALVATSATITGAITATSGSLGAMTVDGTLTIGSSGKLLLNTAATGITMGYITDGYYIRGLNSNVVQFEARASDGKLYAGAGVVRMDSSGVGMVMDGTNNGIRWYNNSSYSTERARIFAETSSGSSTPSLVFSTNNGSMVLGGDSNFGLSVLGNTKVVNLQKPLGLGGGYTDGWVYRTLSTPLTSTSWDGDAYSTTARTTLNLESVFGLPVGVQAVYVRVAARDSASAANDGVFVVLSSSNSAGVNSLVVRPSGLPNDYWAEGTGIVYNNAGSIYVELSASGTNTLDVIIQIWGYFF